MDGTSMKQAYLQTPGDKPRRRLPSPYQRDQHPTVSTSAKEDTIRSMQEKLSDFRAENALLGQLVKDIKAEQDALHKKLAAAEKGSTDAAAAKQQASSRAEDAQQEAKHLQKEVEQLTGVVQSQTLQLDKSKELQKELEDVALDLRDRLDRQSELLRAAKAAEEQQRRRTALAEAQLRAAGLAKVQGMGSTAEQLIVSSTARVRALSEELDTCKAQKAALQERLEQQQQQQQQQHQRQQQQQQQQQGGYGGSPQHVQQQDRALAQARGELQQLRGDLLGQTQQLHARVLQLQTQLAECEMMHARALKEHQEQVSGLRAHMDQLVRERKELHAALLASKQCESSVRLASGEAGAKVARLRGEMARAAEDVKRLLDGHEQLCGDKALLAQQLVAGEAALGESRQEAAQLRRQLVAVSCEALSELRRRVAAEAWDCCKGGPDGQLLDALPEEVGTYIKVLQSCTADAEALAKKLAQEAADAHKCEAQARRLLASAREQQAAAEAALQQAMRRSLVLEGMRLADVQEMQSLEKRLQLAQQDNWTLRDMLAQQRMQGSLAASIDSSPSCQELHCAADGTGRPSLQSTSCGRAGSPVSAAHTNGMAQLHEEQPQQPSSSAQQQAAEVSRRLAPQLSGGSASWQPSTKVASAHLGGAPGPGRGAVLGAGGQALMAGSSKGMQQQQQQQQQPKRRYLQPRKTHVPAELGVGLLQPGGASSRRRSSDQRSQ